MSRATRARRARSAQLGWRSLPRLTGAAGSRDIECYARRMLWSTVLLYHGTFLVNSLCHMVGTVRYKTTDTSRNSVLLALITMGEGWHNNHHHYSKSARMGFFWWEVDISYYALSWLSLFGIVWDMKKPSQRVLETARI